jgi:6-phospho-beta-glucosidase
VRFVILGGSGSATPELGEALAAWPGGMERRPPLRLILVSRSADRLELIASEMRRRVADLPGAPVEVVAETDLERALDGADVVLNAVRVGGLTARAFDESFPRPHGIPGEETIGPGGFANALRTVPVVTRLWAQVAERAPQALAINLTNPSGIVVAAVERELGLRLFSVCDSPVTFCAAIAKRLDMPVETIRARYLGMNHMGWWVPRDGTELEATLDLANGQHPEAVRVQGAVGAPYVRYYVHPERILASQLTAGEVRAEQLQRLESELLSGYASGALDLPRRGAVWYGSAVLPLVDAWLNGSPEIITVGLRNDGRIRGLPDAAITERPVRIERPGELLPLEVPELPQLPAAMLVGHAAFEMLTVEATGASATRDDRIGALMSNPLVRSYDLAVSLVDDIESGSAS